MIEYLRLRNHKGLIECLLSQLGPLNIICGKNSSGKSTVLEAIALSSCRDIGVVLTEHDAQNLVAYMINQIKYAYPYVQINTRQSLQRAASSIVSAQPIWYESDGSVFTERLTALFERDQYLSGLSIYVASTTDWFKKQFDNSPGIVMLPPKRTIETSDKIDTSILVKTTGEGILNSLFHYKNKPELSEERQVDGKIRDAFKDITSGHSYEIYTDENSKINLCFRDKTVKDVLAKDCGLGLQEILCILYFVHDPATKFLIIEEPETHLHPDMQRKLIAHLRSVTNKQFLLSTHSNVFVSTASMDKVFVSNFDGHVHVDDATSRALALESLGYSITDNLVSDLVILVEGPTDAVFIKAFLIKMDIWSTYSIKLWPVGGDIMGQLDLTVFAEKYNIVALLDRDPGSDKVRKIFVELCRENNVPVNQLERYAIENYFTVEALKAVFKGNPPINIDHIDPDVKLEKQIGYSVRKNNARIASEMQIADIRGTDLFTFFESIQQLITGFHSKAN